MVWYYYVFSFVIAFFSKLTDDLIDEKPAKFLKSKKVKYLTAMTYGTIAGWHASFSIEASTILVGVVLAVILARKIHGVHYFGVVSFALAVFLFGFQGIIWPVLAFIIAFGLIDEWLDAVPDRRTCHKITELILRERIILPLACLTLSFYLQNFFYFFFMVAFNLGYDSGNYSFQLLEKWEKKNQST